MGPGADPAATLRAAAEVFVPGSATDETPGAPDVAAELFMSHYLEYLIPGLSVGVPELLDGLAREHYDGRSFAGLTLDERERVLDLLAVHEIVELRDLPQALGILAIAAVYGEWTGQDAEGALVRKPLGWALAGFDGPSRARSRMMRDP